MTTYVELVVNFNDQFTLADKTSLDQKMLQDLGCSGIQDFALDESELNVLLGDKAVTGGPLPADVLEDVEKYCQDQTHKKSTYFFEGPEAQDLAIVAKDFVISHYLKSAVCQLNQCQEESWLEKW